MNIQVDGEPVQARRYKRTDKQKIIEEKIIREMEEARIIRKSHSRWSQNMFINAKGRLCLDLLIYKLLNACGPYH